MANYSLSFFSGDRVSLFPKHEWQGFSRRNITSLSTITIAIGALEGSLA